MESERLEKIERELEKLQDRVSKLEQPAVSQTSTVVNNRETIKLEIEWPPADIGGLHFNEQTTYSEFEKKADGNYYSKDILFNSARDTDDGTGRDLLSEYLESEEVKDAILDAIDRATEEEYDNISVFLPEENQGVKKYNGVSWWYWLRKRSAANSANFAHVNSIGGSNTYGASSVGGCAPAFCVSYN